jgi:hypothetical protein
MPTLFTIFIPMFAFVLAIHAAPVPPSSTNTTLLVAPTFASPSSWSKEAIITLVGVAVAVVSVFVAIVLSSSKLRQWLCCPFRCKSLL